MEVADVESFPSASKTSHISKHDLNPPVSIEEVTDPDSVPRDEELRMLRKFDFLLLPPLALLFVSTIEVLVHEN
jgi:hypothetical protein